MENRKEKWLKIYLCPIWFLFGDIAITNTHLNELRSKHIMTGLCDSHRDTAVVYCAFNGFCQPNQRQGGRKGKGNRRNICLPVWTSTLPSQLSALCNCTLPKNIASTIPRVTFHSKWMKRRFHSFFVWKVNFDCMMFMIRIFDRSYIFFFFSGYFP